MQEYFATHQNDAKKDKNVQFHENLKTFPRA